MFKKLALIVLSFLLLVPAANATVASSTSRVKYTCSGGSSYAFTFGVGATSEIQVIKTVTATAVETTLTETTDYSISATNNDYSSGGTVNTTAACATGNTITILRNVPLTQDSDFEEGMPTLYETFEDSLDKLTRITQQQQEEINRAPKLPESFTVTSNPMPTPAANNYLGWNSSATALENKVTALQVGATPADSNQTYYVDADAADQGATTNSRSIASLLASIGTSKQATIVLPHSGSGNTTTYTVGQNVNWSAYTNVTFKIEPGAVISHGAYTMNIPNPCPVINALQWLSGSGVVTFASKVEAWVEWWGTPSETTLSYALASGSKHIKMRFGTTYEIASTVTVPSTWSGVIESEYGRGKSVFTWTGAATGPMIKWDASQAQMKGVKIDGASTATSGLFLGYAATPTSTGEIVFDDLEISNVNGPAVQLGNYTDNGNVDIDIAKVDFRNPYFYNNKYGVKWDSKEAVAINFYGAFWTGTGTGNLLYNHVYMLRGGQANIYGGGFGAISKGSGDQYAIYIKDGHLNINGLYSDYGSSGGGGGFLHLDTPAITSAANYEPTVLTNCRDLTTGMVTTSYVIRVESALHPLVLIGNHFIGRAGSSTANLIHNPGLAYITSIGNTYRGKSGLASGRYALSLHDTVYDGTNYNNIAPKLGAYKQITNADSTYTLEPGITYLECSTSGGAIIVNLPSTSDGISNLITRSLFIKNVGTGTVTINRAGTNTLDGATSILLNKQYDGVLLENNGQADAIGYWAVKSWYVQTAFSGVSSGVGSIKMSSANAADNAGWLEISSGKFVPYWTDTTP